MKRILYLDATAGVSGDMFVGALLDVGADFEIVREQVASLGLEGVDVRAGKVKRRGLAGTKFDVLDPSTGDPVDVPPRPDGDLRGTCGPEEHDHHAHHHIPTHGHGRTRGHEHRGLREIRELLEKASLLPPGVVEDALAVFELLGCAEARVHGTEVEAIHFHEVGALDAIADVVAACAAFHLLAPDETLCSPIHVGSGTVRCAHGVLPVPAPATVEILKGVPVYSDGTRGELCTPTGAALVRHFCDGFVPMPPMVVEAVGYGAGTKDFGMPNLLRALIGSVSEQVRPALYSSVG